MRELAVQGAAVRWRNQQRQLHIEPLINVPIEQVEPNLGANQMLTPHTDDELDVPIDPIEQVEPNLEDNQMLAPHADDKLEAQLPTAVAVDTATDTVTKSAEFALPLETAENRPSRPRTRKIVKVKGKNKNKSPLRMVDISYFFGKHVGPITHNDFDEAQCSHDSEKTSDPVPMESSMSQGSHVHEK